MGLATLSWPSSCLSALSRAFARDLLRFRLSKVHLLLLLSLLIILSLIDHLASMLNLRHGLCDSTVKGTCILYLHFLDMVGLIMLVLIDRPR